MRPVLDEAARHTCTPMRSQIRADGAEIVADEEDARCRLRRRLAHEVEDGGLDGDVEAGRRLVHDQQRGLGHQRHGDDDALLLAAGELVRIARHHALGVGQAGPRRAWRARAPARPRVGGPVQHRHFDELPADGDDGVQAASSGPGRPSRRRLPRMRRSVAPSESRRGRGPRTGCGRRRSRAGAAEMAHDRPARRWTCRSRIRRRARAPRRAGSKREVIDDALAAPDRG